MSETMKLTTLNIVSSYYYCKNNWEPANVTNKVNSMYSRFKFNATNNTFIVSNEIFGDTILYTAKTLYINISDSYSKIKTLEFKEGSVVDWNVIEKMFNNKNNPNNIDYTFILKTNVINSLIFFVYF